MFVLCVPSANTVMMSVADLRMITFPTDVLNISTGESMQSFLFPQVIWLYCLSSVLVRAVTSLAMFTCDSHYLICLIRSTFPFAMLRTGLGATIRFSLVSCGHCSFLESLLQMAQFHIDQGDQQGVLDAQWQFTQQTYGLHRPSRDGLLQVFRAVSSHIGPGNPAILSVPVSAADSPDHLIEQGWPDLRTPGTVVPWQLFPIDSTRAKSSHRALAYHPTS